MGSSTKKKAANKVGLLIHGFNATSPVEYQSVTEALYAVATALATRETAGIPVSGFFLKTPEAAETVTFDASEKLVYTHGVTLVTRKVGQYGPEIIYRFFGTEKWGTVNIGEGSYGLCISNPDIHCGKGDQVTIDMFPGQAAAMTAHIYSAYQDDEAIASAAYQQDGRVALELSGELKQVAGDHTGLKLELPEGDYPVDELD